jgi:hypothetical protein
MSHWQTGKMELKCSLNVLKRALINIMPEWEKHIKVDEGGQLDLKGMGGAQSGFHLVIPHGTQTGINYEDVGFKLGAGGNWETVRGPNLPRQIRDLEGQVLQQVATMKAKAIAISRGYQLLDVQQQGDDQVVEMLIPESEESRFIGA